MPKPASLRPAPRHFPVLGPYQAPQRYFPGHLLNNLHSITTYGYGLKAIAEAGGLGPCEIARNLKRLPRDAPMPVEQAEAIIEAATGTQHATPETPEITQRIRTEMVQRPLWR